GRPGRDRQLGVERAREVVEGGADPRPDPRGARDPDRLGALGALPLIGLGELLLHVLVDEVERGEIGLIHGVLSFLGRCLTLLGYAADSSRGTGVISLMEETI